MSAKATIELDQQVFTLVNTFHLAPENQRALVNSLVRVTEQTTRNLTGFVAAAVHASLDGQVVINYVQWRSRADFEAMMRVPEMQLHLKEVSSLATAIAPVFCEVAYVAAN